MARNPRAPGRRAATASTLVLVRHGTTTTTGSVLPGRARGLHLSESGRGQAEAVAARLAPLAPAALYCSPLERTRETAAPIARATGLAARTARGLIECDFGEWTGRPLAELRRLAAWRTVQSAPSRFRFPSGESFAEMQARTWEELQRLAAGHPGATVVAVSHADPIKSAVAMAAGVHLDLFQRIVISPCSVTVLLLGESAPVVLTVNSTGDLSTLAPS